MSLALLLLAAVRLVAAAGSLERVGQALEAAVADGDDVECDVEVGELGMPGEPRLRGTADATLLLLRHRLDRVAERRPALLLHLDEPQPPAAPRDQVDLVAGRPHVRAEDLPAAEAVPACGAPFGRVHRTEVTPSRNRAPGSSGGAPRTAPARGRPRSDPA